MATFVCWNTLTKKLVVHPDSWDIHRMYHVAILDRGNEYRQRLLRHDTLMCSLQVVTSRSSGGGSSSRYAIGSAFRSFRAFPKDSSLVYLTTSTFCFSNMCHPTRTHSWMTLTAANDISTNCLSKWLTRCHKPPHRSLTWRGELPKVKIVVVLTITIATIVRHVMPI